MKKFVEFVVQYLTFTKGQVVELPEADADEMVKVGKAKAAEDPSKTQRDHAVALTPAQISEIVAKAIEPLTKKLEDTTTELLELKKTRVKATNNMGPPPGEAPRSPVTGQLASKGTGLSHVRIMKAVAHANLRQRAGMNTLCDVDSILKQQGYKDELDALNRRREEFERQKALGASVLTDGGSLIPETFSAEIIELLRTKTVIRALGYTQMDLSSGNLTIGRQASASSAAYIAEGAVISTSKPGTDQVKLSAKKLASIVVVSNDLIRQASISADEFVRNDLLKVMKIREDIAFLRGDGTQDTPKGIRNDVNANNVYAATAVAPKVPTLAEVRAELAKAKYFLAKNNVETTAADLAWVFGPRVQYYLELLQDGNGNTAVFATELAQGRLWGIPFMASTQVPENLGGGTDESEIYLYRKDEFMIGDHMQMEVLVEPNGTYEEGGAAKSGFSRDETPIRVISAHDSKLRHNISAVVVTTVRWGAP